MKLTEKQKRFCEEYLVDLNATQAAIRSGYSEKTAYKIGAELLHKTSVSDFLKTLREKQSERTGITADDVIRELKEIAFAEGVEITGKEKMKALELLGKHLGMFTENNISSDISDNGLIDALAKKSGEVFTDEN